MENPFAREPEATTSWLWQVFTGIGLVFLLGLHIIANHFIAKGGLRDFSEIVTYLRHPLVLVLEVLFLIFVSAHAMLGVRAIVLDFGWSDRVEKRISQALTVLGILTVTYGLWVTWVVIR
jgi:succinate dehydrogenase hydrophobic anchor subunit